MKRLTRTLPLLLAAALQLLPLLRNIVTSPTAGSSFAIILRWGIGSAAVLGAYDARSAASGISMTSPTNLVGTVGVQMNTNVNIVIGGGNTAVPADGFILSTINNSLSSPLITNGQSTAVCLPAGLTFRCVSINNATNIYGVLSGIPTAAGKTNITVGAYYAQKAQIFPTNIWITILAATAPIITNQPASITNVAGGNATFNVTAGGVPAVAYQWNYNTNTALLNATNTSLSLTGLRASQAGVYTVVVTNSAGSVTSAIANLVITNPNPPTMTAPVKNGSGFQFTFVPVVGLTNSVLTNNVIIGGSWGVLTNVPPPATANPITVTDPFSATNRFYRVQILP